MSIAFSWLVLVISSNVVLNDVIISSNMQVQYVLRWTSLNAEFERGGKF